MILCLSVVDVTLSRNPSTCFSSASLSAAYHDHLQAERRTMDASPAKAVERIARVKIVTPATIISLFMAKPLASSDERHQAVGTIKVGCETPCSDYMGRLSFFQWYGILADGSV